MKSCSVCKNDSSPYKCPKCSLPYCSVACCKAHKEACTTRESVMIHSVASSVIDPVACDSSSVIDTVVCDSSSVIDTVACDSSSLQYKIDSSTRLQEFLTTNVYLKTQLPVLLARIDRTDPSQPAQMMPSSELARDLERRQRIENVLKEAVATDPIVAELFNLLQEEGLI